MKVAFFVFKYNKNQGIFSSKRIKYFPTVCTKKFRLFPHMLLCSWLRILKQKAV